MKLTPQRKLLLGFSLLAVLPLVLGLFAFQNVEKAENAAQSIARANQFILTLESFETDLHNLDVAEHQFVLSGDPQFPEVLTRYQARFMKTLERLTELESERMWREPLEQLLVERLEEMRITARVRQENGIDAAADRVLHASPGKAAMTDLHRVVSDLHAKHASQLREQTSVQNTSFRNTMIVFGILMAFNIALVTFIGAGFAREQSRIRNLNAELEKRVALRTEALQRSNEDLQQFAYVASHDLKEPMRMISSYSSLLQRRYKERLDADANEYIGFITDGVKRMNTLITDLLEYSQAGEIPEEAIVPIDAISVLQSVLVNLKVTIAESRARVTHAELPQIAYDPMRLTQIFQNLIGNAIKYRGDRTPEIEVRAESNKDETIFAIKDNGIGIDEQHKEEIFGIFKRLHKKEYEGTGIGLAMVKKIVERQGGRIWVESQPGKGSTFYFTVPRQRGATAEAATT